MNVSYIWKENQDEIVELSTGRPSKEVKRKKNYKSMSKNMTNSLNLLRIFE